MSSIIGGSFESGSRPVQLSAFFIDGSKRSCVNDNCNALCSESYG